MAGLLFGLDRGGSRREPALEAAPWRKTPACERPALNPATARAKLWQHLKVHPSLGTTAKAKAAPKRETAPPTTGVQGGGLTSAHLAQPAGGSSSSGNSTCSGNGSPMASPSAP